MAVSVCDCRHKLVPHLVERRYLHSLDGH